MNVPFATSLAEFCFPTVALMDGLFAVLVELCFPEDLLNSLDSW
jgi:hypothetical protein